MGEASHLFPWRMKGRRPRRHLHLIRGPSERVLNTRPNRLTRIQARFRLFHLPSWRSINQMRFARAPQRERSRSRRRRCGAGGSRTATFVKTTHPALTIFRRHCARPGAELRIGLDHRWSIRRRRDVPASARTGAIHGLDCAAEG